MTAFINTVSFQPGRRTRLMLALGPRRENTFLSRVFGNKEKSDVLEVVGRGAFEIDHASWTLGEMKI